MRTNIYDINDRLLLKKLENRIRWDIRVSNSDIAMTVKNGCVTMFGIFDRPFRQVAAVNLISSTEGVFDVNDQSQVLGSYFRTDHDLEVLISKQFLSQNLMPDEWIDVEVCNGIAKLEGFVTRPRIKAFAARATWELSGIKDCINLIDIAAVPEDLPKSLTKTYTAAPIFAVT